MPIPKKPKLDWYGEAIVKEILEQIEGHLDDVADAALNRAQQLVPYDTGELHDAIAKAVITDFKKREVKAYVGIRDEGDVLDRAFRIEFGYKGTDSLGRDYDEPGMPFLRPATGAAAGELARVLRLAKKGQAKAQKI